VPKQAGKKNGLQPLMEGFQRKDSQKHPSAPKDRIFLPSLLAWLKPGPFKTIPETGLRNNGNA
jgi:hypothetical protein